MDQTISNIQEAIQNTLDRSRYEHTLGVMYTAASLAMRYGEDMKKAMVAGLLHDCAKRIPTHQKLQMCEEYHLNVSDTEKANPELLHAKLGARLAKDIYKIEDPEILQAIESHTTGRPEMSLLEKIIYIADYMEPGRKELPNMEDVRKLAFSDIDKCLCRILKDSLVYLETKGLPIDIMTEKTYLYYKDIFDNQEE